MATPLPLEGDGLTENLFYFLWCKDDFGAGPRIYIPHTVLYKFTQPSAWYFTSLKSGKIKKKPKVNLNNIQIEREFTKKRTASDIFAYYIYFTGTNSSSNGEHGRVETSFWLRRAAEEKCWPPAPQLPQRIDSFDEIHAADFGDLAAVMGGSLESNNTSQSSASALQQREETFFRELHQQKDLERGHPLHHMLESTNRLASSTKKNQQQQSHKMTASSSSSQRSDCPLGTTNGSEKSTKSPYSVVLRLRESVEEGDRVDGHTGGLGGASAAPGGLGDNGATQSHGSPKKKAKKTKKPKRVKPSASGVGDQEGESKISKGAVTRFVSSREKKASEEHQDFLFAALSQAQAQLEHMESLASILPASELSPGDTILEAEAELVVEDGEESGDDEEQDDESRADDTDFRTGGDFAADFSVPAGMDLHDQGNADAGDNFDREEEETQDNDDDE